MVGRIYSIARWTALFGGLILCLMALLMVLSIGGRSLIAVGLAPIPGDFEVVELATGVVIFFFLPWCYVRGGHATVDLFYTYMSPRIKKSVNVLSDILMLILWLILTWLLWEGLLEKIEYGETTFLLQIPVWWAYAICMVGAVIGCLTYLATNLIQLGLASLPEGWSAEATGGH